MICYHKYCAKVEHSSSLINKYLVLNIPNSYFLAYLEFPQIIAQLLVCRKVAFFFLDIYLGVTSLQITLFFCLCPFLAPWTPCSPISSFSLAHLQPVAVWTKNYYFMYTSVQNLAPNYFNFWNPGLPTFVKQYHAVETVQWQLRSLLYFLSCQCSLLVSFCWFSSAKGKDNRISIWPSFLSLQ